jgi:hypothetical protein
VSEFEELLECMKSDAMVFRAVELPTEEVVFFKSLVEAYPGVAAVHAGRKAGQRAMTQLCVATSPSLERELDGLLGDLAAEIDRLTWKRSDTPSV